VSCTCTSRESASRSRRNRAEPAAPGAVPFFRWSTGGAGCGRRRRPPIDEYHLCHLRGGLCGLGRLPLRLRQRGQRGGARHPVRAPVQLAGTGFAVAFILLGCVAGALFAGPLADRIGRRWILALTAAASALAALWTGWVRSVVEFNVARFLSGVAMGAANVVSPAYIAEISSAPLRGRLTSLNQLRHHPLGGRGFRGQRFAGHQHRQRRYQHRRDGAGHRTDRPHRPPPAAAVGRGGHGADTGHPGRGAVARRHRRQR
jgi:Sugar (and other) transporter